MSVVRVHLSVIRFVSIVFDLIRLSLVISNRFETETAEKSRKMEMFRLALAVIMLATAKSQLTAKAKFFDHFGDETTASYTGGYVEITCDVPWGHQCDANFNLLDPAGKPQDSVKCDGGKGKLRLNITETMAFGEYQCEYKGQHSPTGSLGIHYRLCSGHECKPPPDCKDSKEVCVVSKSGTNTCGKIDSKWCDVHDDAKKKLSPGPGLGAHFTSLCGAIAGERSLAWVESWTTRLDEAESPQVQYSGTNRHLNERFQVLGDVKEIVVKPSTSLTISRARLQCVIKQRNGTIINVAVSNRIIDLPDAVFNQGTQIFKLFCTLIDKNNPIVLATLSNFLIFIGGTVNITAIKDLNDTAYTTQLQSHLDPEPSREFVVSDSWTRDKILLPAAVESSLAIYDDGAYQNKKKVDVRMCFANERVNGSIESAVVENVKARPTTTTSTTEKSTTTVSTEVSTEVKKGWFEENFWIVVGCSIGAVLLIVLAVVLVCYCRSKKKETPPPPLPAPMPPPPLQSRKEETPPMSPSLKELHDENGPDKGTSANLLTHGIVELTDYGLRYVQEPFQKDDEDEDRRMQEGRIQLAYPVESLLENEPTKKENQVVFVIAGVKLPKPMNRLQDYNGNPVYVGQPPNDEDIAEYLATSFQEKIGTVVIVGKFREGKPKPGEVKRMAPLAVVRSEGPYRFAHHATMYLDEERKKRMSKMANVPPKMQADWDDKKRHPVPTLRVEVETLRLTRKAKGCDTYLLNVSIETKESRMITLIHVPTFNSSSDPNVMLELLEHIDHQVTIRSKEKMPGLMLHGSDAKGQQEAMVLLTAYIGRQQVVQEKRINFGAIVRYVRGHVLTGALSLKRLGTTKFIEMNQFVYRIWNAAWQKILKDEAGESTDPKAGKKTSNASVVATGRSAVAPPSKPNVRPSQQSNVGRPGKNVRPSQKSNVGQSQRSNVRPTQQSNVRPAHKSDYRA